MNAKQLFLQAVLVLMGLYGCAFEPHEEFISPIKPPEAITVTFELNDPVFNQPFYLVEPTLFRIKLQDASNPLLSVEVTAGGSEVPAGIDNSHDFYFFLEPDKMGIGTHSVSIRCFLDTQSGSLANLAGTEIYVVDQSFEISIDPKQPTFDSFTAGIENEYLTFNWNPPKDQRNYVYKIQLRSAHYWHYPDTVIYEPQVSRFIDYGYLGGHLYYKVTVKGYGFEFVLGEGNIEEEPADFTAFIQFSTWIWCGNQVYRYLGGQGEAVFQDLRWRKSYRGMEWMENDLGDRDSNLVVFSLAGSELPADPADFH